MNLFKNGIKNHPIINNLGLRSLITIIILATAEVFIFAVSYFVTVLLPRTWEYLHISEADLSAIVGVFGGVVLLCQLPAGVLADRYSNRLLVTIGLIFSALSLFWFALLVHFGTSASEDTLYYQYVVICILWGLSTSLFFWTPMQRLISQHASKENQGLAFNIYNSSNGLSGTIFVWVGAVVLIALIEKFNSPSLFAYYIYLNCIGIIAIAVVLFFLLKDHEAKRRLEISKRASEELKDGEKPLSQRAIFLKLVKNWKIWAITFGILSIVIYQGILGIYLKDFLSGTLMMPAIWVSILAGLRLFVTRLSLLPLGGRVNRLPSFIFTLSILQIVAAFSLLPFILLPGFSVHPAAELSPAYLLALNVILGSIFVLTGFVAWLMVSLQTVQITEIDRPPRSYGMTLGLLMMFSYSSRGWFTPIVSAFISSNQITVDNQTFTSWHVYQSVFVVSLIICLVASFLTYLVYRSNKSELKRIGETNFRWRNLGND